MEIVLHVQLFEECSASCLYTLGFTAAFGLVISFLLSFLPMKANKIVTMVLVSLLSIVYCSQIVYDAVFGTMYSMSLIGMGGAALTSFWKETLLTIVENIPVLLLMLLPIPFTAMLLKKKRPFHVRRDWFRAAVICLAAIVQIVTLLSLRIGGTGDYTDYYFYHSDTTTTDQAAERFGLLTTMRLEFFGGGQQGEAAEPTMDIELDFEPIVQPTQKPAQNPEDATVSTEPQKVEYGYNMLEIDFDELNASTTSETFKKLNAYVQSLAPTKQNKYTGMLKDYNLITICAESFATAAIDEKLTPTLYKLANEGFVFNNFYNSYPNVTTDGEYSFCFGLWPDTTRGKSTSSFYATRDIYEPFALGNAFKEQRGIQCYAYHNYNGGYYGRNETHPNMGYLCKFAKDGMTFSTSWPSSDLEMMEQSVADYISSDKQFHAYYMTFSGHYKYDKTSNPMAAWNYHKVKDLRYTEAGKCYLACNIELEKALADLMEKLEEAGIADKTAIVLAGDHFPYGLSDGQYSQLIGYEIDSFSKYKSTLIFWVGGMEEPVYVDDYMCNIDILPTILNLWGFQYDSRLLAGRDIFSDSEHIAILRDQSFLTDKVWFNASSGKATWLVDESTVEPGYLDNHIKMVKNQFSACTNILNKGYYNYLFEKGNIKITFDSWFKGGTEETEAPAAPPETTPPAVIPPEGGGTGDGGNTGDGGGTDQGGNTGGGTDQGGNTGGGTDQGGNTGGGTDQGGNAGGGTDQGGNAGGNAGGDGNTGDQNQPEMVG